MSSNKRAINFVVIVAFIVLLLVVILISEQDSNKQEKITNKINSSMAESKTPFRIISSSENEDLYPILSKFAQDNNIKLEVEYAGTLEIMEKLNDGESYDAVWTSNSIWLYMLDKNVKVTESKSTSINPVVFGVSKEKARELGFLDRELKTQDILDAIKSGNLKFSMSNPTQTNTGATAYLGLLTTLAGNPEVLRKEHLENENLKSDLVSLFSGMERSSGSEAFLEDLIVKGNYEAVVTYESSIININKKLEKQNKEPLYILYPIDGVSISDSPLAYIDNKDEKKKEIFKKLQNYILSKDVQKQLENKGRRTWYGGINENVNKEIFNPNWGIDTTKYIVPVKYPNTEIIKTALNIYQTELRKPLHIVFCLDYSGSMKGSGFVELVKAMNYILTPEEAGKDLLQFGSKDKITVIPFSTNVINTWTTENGEQTEELKRKIFDLTPTGSTNIYDTSTRALEILNEENQEIYNTSVILMTDGLSNRGNYNNLEWYYNKINKDIPIYSIMFGEAYEYELEKISELTNAKVFDGKTDLKKAFKEVRGYN